MQCGCVKLSSSFFFFSFSDFLKKKYYLTSSCNVMCNYEVYSGEEEPKWKEPLVVRKGSRYNKFIINRKEETNNIKPTRQFFFLILKILMERKREETTPQLGRTTFQAKLQVELQVASPANHSLILSKSWESVHCNSTCTSSHLLFLKSTSSYFEPHFLSKKEGNFGGCFGFLAH